MTIFFSGDPHFCHFNVIRFGNRPYQTYWEMNDAIIKNWNSVVQPEDTVYLLGDIGIGKRWEIVKCAFELSGTIHWILGNHDKKAKGWAELKKRFASISTYKEIKVNDPEADYRGNKYQKIVLFHYPIHSWNGMHYGAWHLHSHTHGTFFVKDNKILDVGMDCWGCIPVSYERVKMYMAHRKFVAVDGHGKKGDYRTGLK